MPQGNGCSVCALEPLKDKNLKQLSQTASRLVMVRTAFKTVNSNHHRSGKHTSGEVATAEMRQELNAKDDEEHQEFTAIEL